jgi:hypothetical protein
LIVGTAAALAISIYLSVLAKREIDKAVWEQQNLDENEANLA